MHKYTEWKLAGLCFDKRKKQGNYLVWLKLDNI